MKTRLLFLLIPLVTFHCKKEDNIEVIVEEGYVLDESVLGDYIYYEKGFGEGDLNICVEQLTKSVSKISNTEISFLNQNLTFEYEEDNVIAFKNSDNFPGIEYTFHHYPCSDSLTFTARDSYSGIRSVGFGKKVNGKNCPNNLPSIFEPSNCAQGPDNAYCYSSVNTKTNYSFGYGSEFQYTSVDTINQTVQIGVLAEFGITIPTDSTLTLLPGDYWIGDIPIGDKPITDFFIQDYGHWGIGFSSFTEGHLNVNKDGEIYTLSFDLTCSEPANFTGYYQGEIN